VKKSGVSANVYRGFASFEKEVIFEQVEKVFVLQAVASLLETVGEMLAS
jgi:hypothetical protein